MTHVHEWEYVFVTTPDHHVFACKCGEYLDDDDVERRLNATERLSADAADYAAEFTQAGTNKHNMDQESEGNIYYLTDALRAYAAALAP